MKLWPISDSKVFAIKLYNIKEISDRRKMEMKKREREREKQVVSRACFHLVDCLANSLGMLQVSEETNNTMVREFWAPCIIYTNFIDLKPWWGQWQLNWPVNWKKRSRERGKRKKTSGKTEKWFFIYAQHVLHTAKQRKGYLFVYTARLMNTAWYCIALRECTRHSMP